MDRIIKFRGKQIDNGKWIIGSLVILENDRKFIIPLGNNSPSKKSPYIPYRYEVKHDTVGQFTGLHDKNGKEVYEGDIVKYIGNGLGDEFETEVKFEGAGFDPIAAIYWMSDIEGVGCEIIGNIHDNPRIAERRLK